MADRPRCGRAARRSAKARRYRSRGTRIAETPSRTVAPPANSRSIVAALSSPRPDRQQRQDALVLAAAESRDRTRRRPRRTTARTSVRSNAGSPSAPSRRPAAFPAEAVGDQREALRAAVVGQIADRDERVLQAGRDHREVLGILGAQPQQAPQAPPRTRLDARAAGGELLLEPLIAAVEMIDAVDRRSRPRRPARRAPATPRRADRSPSPARRSAAARRAPAPRPRAR